MLGVIIETGPQNWQILQQRDGYAEIELTGHYVRRTEGTAEQVYGRVVREDTGDPVLSWQPADMLPDSHWHLKLEQVPAGGLYRIETCLQEDASVRMEWCTRGDMVHHLGVGDLFVLAGQSNSAGYGKDIVSDPPELGVHFLRSSDRWDLATHPFNDSTDTCHPVNQEAANPGHCPYLSFGKAMHKALGYPIGLIPCALGGSPLSAWNPEEEGSLYNNMLQCIRSQGGSVKAVAWYQGCADTAGGPPTEQYLARFAAMVRHLREDLQAPDLPVFTFQIARFLVKPVSETEDWAWDLIREQQRQAARQIPGVYVLPTLDGMVSDMIHNSAPFNLVLGERLAKQMLSKLYGRPSLCDAPDLRTLCWDGPQTLRMTFAPVADYLYCFEMEPEKLPFWLEDSQGRLRITAYTVGRDQITLQLDRPARDSVRIVHHRGQNPLEHCIVDFANHYPTLAFSQTLAVE